MMVLRFMGAHEAIRLLAGDTLESHIIHSEGPAKYVSESVGFCFALVKEHDPNSGMYAAARYLSGNVTMEVCLVGNLKRIFPKQFKTSRGRYNVDDKPTIIDELCTTYYSLADFKDWSMYTPEPVPAAQIFKIYASPNWLQPVLTTSSTIVKT